MEAESIAAIPVGRYGDPSEYDAAAFLASVQAALHQLRGVTTATLTTILLKKGLRNPPLFLL